MKNFRTLIATVTLAFTALILAPTAASAQYTPTGPEDGTVTAVPGEPVTITFSGFEPNEDVLFTLTGENAAGATMASLAAVVNSQTLVKPADASGAVSVTITLPDNASGEYQLTAEGLSSGAVAGVTIIVVAPGATTPTRSGALPATGGDSSTTMALVIGGVLLAGGLAVATTSMRRQRQA